MTVVELPFGFDFLSNLNHINRTSYERVITVMVKLPEIGENLGCMEFDFSNEFFAFFCSNSTSWTLQRSNSSLYSSRTTQITSLNSYTLASSDPILHPGVACQDCINKVDTFYTILDMQLGELNARFSDSTMEFLVCITCIDPSNSFSHFDKDKLLRLVDFYPQDFTELNKCELNDQLDTYIVDMRLSSEFHGLNEISDLARKMVETRRNKVYPLIYLILTLSLMLSVVVAKFEMASSAMSILKSRLHSRMNDE